MAKGQTRTNVLRRERPAGARRRLRRVAVALSVAAAGLAIASSSALAASTHPWKEDLSTGANCNPVGDVAVDSAGGYLYVACDGLGLNNHRGSIRKFTLSGTPVPFTASVPYVNGNEINEDPNAPVSGTAEPYEFGVQNFIDVDNSSAHPGYIYVASYWGSGDVDIFKPDGEYVASIGAAFNEGEAGGVGVDQLGNVYVPYDRGFGYSRISKYNTAWHEILRILPTRYDKSGEYSGPCCTRTRPDSTGAIWQGDGSPYFGGDGKVSKYEADQFNTNLSTGPSKNATATVAHESPFLTESFPAGTIPGYGFDVDLSNNDVYIDQKSAIVPFSQGIEGDPVHQNGPTFGEGKLTQSLGVAIDASGNVYATSSPNTIVKFEKGAILPTVTTKPTPGSDVGHTTATVKGIVDPAGGGEIEECQVKFGETTAYGDPGSPVACNEALPYPGGGPTEVSASISGLTVGKTYHYRFEAANEHGSNFGGDRTFEAKAVLQLETKPATEITENQATLQGQLDADGMATEYFYEYGPSNSYGLKTKTEEVTGPPGELKTTPLAIKHLQTGHKYHYRLIAKNSLGTTRGGDSVFRTASPPEIVGTGVENVTDTSADVHASINPVGYDTTYQLEYGTSPSYGQSLPASPENDIGSGNEPVGVNVHLSGLPPASTIHYRIVATNAWGTSVTDDTTFNFRPPSCPNAHVRQLTGSSYLPDCRAYEIVSPGYAGAVQLMPGEGFEAFEATFGGSSFAQSPQNFGYASSPARFMYFGALGAIRGQDVPNSLVDVYMATRTNTGWVTSNPGLKGSETAFTFGRACSNSMALCVDHIGPFYGINPETGEYEEFPKSSAPFLYKADGTRLGRLPTNVKIVKHGTEFHGDEELSGDFSHFIFSTQTRFTPDGVGNEPPGSVYDNNIGAKTVSVISKDTGGEDIPVEPPVAGDKTHMNGIASVSTDGSHVLIAGTTQGPCDLSHYPFECPYILGFPARLYMRVNNEVTYDVSRGEEVNFVFATRDDKKVFFTTTEALLPQDTDTSRDLYMWEEQGDKLTLISKGEGENEAGEELGNRDECSASWVTKCGVEPLTPEKAVGTLNYEYVAHAPGVDDVGAAESGDIYFYSPEDLVEGEVGGDNQRNLYLYRNGHLRLVTTFDPGTQIERITISPDGSHAAFMTKSSLTSYNSQGQKEVYTYNAETNAIRCASCNPAGTPPVPGADIIRVAEAGPFMADDGRTFFATKESLVPQDTDGIRDVYEYVNGRAQLITTGTGNRESTGGLEVVSAFFGNLQIGLEAVSRSGSDVYFSTFESLVPEDQNGSFLKMYDARSGGGFDVTPDLGPCAAADECHGVGTEPPAPPDIRTAGSLGSSGNLPAPKKHHKRHHKKAHKRKKRHKKRHHHRKHTARRHRSHRNG